VISRVWAHHKNLIADRPILQWQKCSSVNVLSSDIRVMQIFAGVWEIWGVKQESGRLRCRFLYLSLAIFSESSSPRLKSATHSICVKLLHKHDKVTQCCRAFTLALARLSCKMWRGTTHVMGLWSKRPFLPFCFTFSCLANSDAFYGCITLASDARKLS